MMVDICEICGENEERLQGHHVLPEWAGGVDEDIIMVCGKCHKKADALFLRLYIDPFGENGYGAWGPGQRNRERCRKYHQKHKAERHEYYQRNREDIIERSRKWNQQHQEQRREYIRRYYQKHKNDQ